jgi:hypothetical protein
LFFFIGGTTDATQTLLEGISDIALDLSESFLYFSLPNLNVIKKINLEFGKLVS